MSENEMINTTSTEETSEAESITADYDPDDWSDLENDTDWDVLDGDQDKEVGESVESDHEESAEPEADQQKDEAEEDEEKPAADEQGAVEEQEKADQPELVELKHLGQVVRVTPEQRDAYAQMGLDYQRIREDRDAARAEVARLSEIESYLKELAAPQGMTVEELIDGARAEALSHKENIDKSIALQRIKLDRDRKKFEEQQALAKKEQQAKDAETSKRQEQFLRFAKEYPNVNPNDIPKDVWDRFRDGMDLVSSYAQYEAKTLRSKVASLESKLEKEKQNKVNKNRSTGSQKSAGSESEMDAFDRAWYDGT